ncbi:MAG TPA: hypothetical protein VFY29_17185, partial [Terriglobia bacterium]|nr:hypothetical protein [Terriglobia bacterium]
QTDDRGVFRMFWFPPGDYYISATPPQRNIKGNPQETWAKTYFPGVVDTRGAVPFAAAEGAELNGIDFAIRAEATRRISGRIINPFTDADGKPTVPSAAFVLIPQSPVGLFDDTANQSFQNLVPDRSKGEFEIRGVLPGVYDLMVSAPTGTANTPERVVIFNGGTVQFGGASNSIPAWGRVRVDVGREDITNVTVPIKAGLQVRVRVTMDGAPPPYTMAAPPQRGGINTAVLNALVARGISTEEAIAASRAASNAGAPAQVPTPRVRLGLQSKDNAPVAAASSQATFDPSGLYVFPSVPQGSYRMQVNLSGQDQEAYVADIRLGGASIYDDGLFIDGPLPGDIEVAIVSRGSRVQGAVETVESRPGANAVVALVPAENRRQNLTLYKTSRTDAKGNFTLRGVAPGIYKLFAWEDVPNTAWQNAEFLSRYEQLGQTITVMGGESLNTSLKLIPKNYGRP